MNFNRFNPLSIGGRMSEKDAGRVGMALVNGVVRAVQVLALATLIHVVRWW